MTRWFFAGAPEDAFRQEIVEGHDVLVLINVAVGVLLEADVACTAGGTGFLGATSRGLAAFVFVNLHHHTCASAVSIFIAAAAV